MLRRNTVPVVRYGVISVGFGLAVPVQVHKNDLFNSQDALARNHVAYFRARSQGRTAKSRGRQPHLDQITLNSRAYEVNFGNILRNCAAITQLKYCVNCRFLIYPLQQAAAEQRPIGIQVFRPNPFPGSEVYISCIRQCFPIVWEGPD
jgi:hypothetical protein